MRDRVSVTVASQRHKTSALFILALRTNLVTVTATGSIDISLIEEQP
jgi:hypothetical protein